MEKADLDLGGCQTDPQGFYHETNISCAGAPLGSSAGGVVGGRRPGPAVAEQSGMGPDPKLEGDARRPKKNVVHPIPLRYHWQAWPHSGCEKV